jgi:GNAT superfamily N-acetyltransferase
LKLLRIKEYSGEEAVEIISGFSHRQQSVVDLVDQGKCHVYAIILFGKRLGRVYLTTELNDKDLADGKDICYLSHLYVHSRLRGKGLGTRLVKHVIRNAKQLGFNKLTLTVDEKEERNVKLYKRLGFTTLVKTRQREFTVKREDGECRITKTYLVLMKDI